MNALILAVVCTVCGEERSLNEENITAKFSMNNSVFVKN